MNLFLHITVSNTPSKFGDPIEKWVKENVQDISAYSLDNHSEAIVIDTAVKAISQSKRLFIYLESDNSNPSKVLKVIKAAFEKKSEAQLKVFQDGDNQKLDVMSKRFGDLWVSGEDLKGKISRFFRDQA